MNNTVRDYIDENTDCKTYAKHNNRCKYIDTSSGTGKNNVKPNHQSYAYRKQGYRMIKKSRTMKHLACLNG